jgi:hypothetical protein
MIDVRFMVPIVRKEDSSNHSHDHTHDRYHLGRQCRNDYPDHSLPQVSASEHTYDHSHAVLIAAGLDWRRLRSSRLDDVIMTRLDRVPSTMPPGCSPC